MTDGFAPIETAFVKIGIATDPLSRLRQIQTSNPRRIYLDKMYFFERRSVAEGIEALLHDRFKHRKARGEWFKYGEFIDIKIKGSAFLLGENLAYIQGKKYTDILTANNYNPHLKYNDYFGDKDLRADYEEFEKRKKGQGDKRGKR